MPDKRKVFILKSLAYRILTLILTVFILAPGLAVADIQKDIDGLVPDVVQAKVREFATPVMDPLQSGAEAPKVDPVLDKLRKNRKKFFKKQQNKRTKFINDARHKNYPAEKLQAKLADFSQKQESEARKFLAKEQEKLQEHQEKLKEEEGIE